MSVAPRSHEAAAAGGGGIVYACITPHGSEVVPELAAVGALEGGTPVGAPAAVGGSGNLEPVLAKFAVLTRAMEEIGRRVRRAAPDTIIVATPHNLRLDGGHTAVVTSESTSGSLTAEAPLPAPDVGGLAARAAATAAATIEASFPCDRELAADIIARARKAGVPVVGVNYGALGGPNSLIPMDWGALIPLYFMGERAGTTSLAVSHVRVRVGPWKKGGGVVLIGPSRDAPREALVKLGGVVAEAAAASGKKVVFVASCDHGHAHLAGGPYGYDPASAVYDKLVRDMVKADRLEDLLGIDPGLVEAGKPDSLWQMLVLLGVLRRQAAVSRPMSGRFLAYEVPTYFGMLCAAYEPRA